MNKLIAYESTYKYYDHSDGGKPSYKEYHKLYLADAQAFYDMVNLASGYDLFTEPESPHSYDHGNESAQPQPEGTNSGTTWITKRELNWYR